MRPCNAFLVLPFSVTFTVLYNNFILTLKKYLIDQFTHEKLKIYPVSYIEYCYVKYSGNSRYILYITSVSNLYIFLQL
jgi:hypothetical protein